MKGTSVKKLIGMFSVAGAVATIIAMIAIHGASAHARYDSSTPAKGAVLATAPASVVVNFGENIQTTNGSFGLTVMKDGGGSVTARAVTASDTSLTVPLQANAGNGRYVVNWNNTSEDDGDALSGAFAFYVGPGPTAAQTASDQQLESVETNQLATASAEAAEATPLAGTPATSSSPAAAASPGGSQLPSTGTGTSTSVATGWAVAATLLGLLGLASATAAVAVSRSRR